MYTWFRRILTLYFPDFCRMPGKMIMLVMFQTNISLFILNHQIMEYWKTTVTILLPLLANIFSYWGLLRSGGLNTRKYWLVEVRRPQYEKILASRGDWEWLYCDSSRGIRWNIAWALGKSLGLRPRDFPRAQAIFHRIPLLSSQYSYNIALFNLKDSCHIPPPCM